MIQTNALANKLAGIAKERAAGEQSPPVTEPAPDPAGGHLSYEERTKRATFHVDVALLDEMASACRRHDISKAKFIETAIEHRLAELG